ncbi:MAG: hypothetical protein H6606_04510 [Flavobacteriales bacterium]|nr:hypothetical protein [Flavobacteriales bacterium]
MKKSNILFLVYTTALLCASNTSVIAERVYHIEKQKVGGNGTGLYEFITQGSWNIFKSDYSVTITCEGPGSNPCVVQTWPPSILIPDDVEAAVLLDFQGFIALHDANFENGTLVNEVVHHVYMSTEGPVDIYFHSIVGSNGLIVYELHVV